MKAKVSPILIDIVTARPMESDPRMMSRHRNPIDWRSMSIELAAISHGIDHRVHVVCHSEKAESEV